MDKKLKYKLYSAFFILLMILAISAFFSFIPFTKFAKALSPNYSKVSGDQLTTTIWNNLPADFVARTGGAVSAMQGALDMGGNRVTNMGAPAGNNDAVNQITMTNAIAAALSSAGSIRNTSGTGIRMVCGSTQVTAGNSVQYDSSTLQTDVNTTAAGFSTAYFYFSSLVASGGSHYKITSANSIYTTPGLPFSQSFRIYLHFDDYNNNMGGVISLANAIGWGWTINWCGAGN